MSKASQLLQRMNSINESFKPKKRINEGSFQDFLSDIKEPGWYVIDTSGKAVAGPAKDGSGFTSKYSDENKFKVVEVTKDMLEESFKPKKRINESNDFGVVLDKSMRDSQGERNRFFVLMYNLLHQYALDNSLKIYVQTNSDTGKNLRVIAIVDAKGNQDFNSEVEKILKDTGESFNKKTSYGNKYYTVN